MKHILKVITFFSLIFLLIGVVSAEGTFTDLQNEIYNAQLSGNNLTLGDNYTYNSGIDVGIYNGVQITENDFIVDGKGFTVNGNNLSKIFQVNGNNITFKNINLINGRDINYGYGGAIYAQGNVAIFNSTFTNNHLMNYGYGGAIYAQGNVSVYNSTFYNNSALYGGGAIYTYGAVIIYDSNFTNNFLTSQNSGGAISGYDIYVYNSSFDNNSAGHAGAIYSNYNLRVYDSNFTNNYASSGDSGAIFASYGVVNIYNSNFINNSAYYGSGAFRTYGSNVTIYGSNFINNSGNYDGAVYIQGYDDNIINISNSVFKNNKAIDGSGGALQVSGNNVTLYNLIFINNSAVSSYSGLNGGGALIAGGNVNMSNCIFINNSAEMGGAIAADYTNLTVYNSTFINNSAYDRIGGAIAGLACNLDVVNSTFIGNTAVNNGGAINVIMNRWVNVTGSYFENNRATSGSAISIFMGTANVNYNIILDENPINNRQNAVMNIDFNWWGSNDGPTGLTGTNIQLNNYYVMNLSSTEEYPIIGENYTFKYALVLNGTTDDQGVSKLPEFVANLTLNSVNISDIDGRFEETFTVIVPSNYNNISAFYNDNFITDLFFTASNGFTKIVIDAPNNGTYDETIPIIVKLINELNETITGQNITITIGGVDYSGTTDGNGSILINYLANKTGIITIDAAFNKTDKFNASSLSKNITIFLESSVLNANNIVMYFKNGTQYIVTLIDSQGNPLSGQNITITVNGVSYEKQTDANGTFKLDINLNPGNYEITTVFNGTDGYEGSTITTNLTVLTIIETSGDLIKYFRNDSQYHVRILDGQGNPLNGAVVTFNINGVFYTLTTNVFGVATLNINLNPGTYTVTVSYGGLNVSNTITVLQTLIGEDLNKTFGDGSTYNVKVLDNIGQPLEGAVISVNIHGMFYYIISDNMGIASLNIDLNPGSYIATATWNTYSTSNTIIVKP